MGKIPKQRGAGQFGGSHRGNFNTASARGSSRGGGRPPKGGCAVVILAVGASALTGIGTAVFNLFT